MSSTPPPSLSALLDETEWVRALASRLVASSHEAEDLAQETMARALFNPPADGRSVRGWLSVVLTNLLRARRRRPDPALEVARDGGHSYEPSTLETVERAEAHQSVVDAVMSLPEPFRTTVLLRYFEGRGPSEIAALEGVPLATVTSRLTRAHGRLREKLQGGDSSPNSGLLCLAPLLIPGRATRTTALPALPSVSLLIAMTTTAKIVSAAILIALGALLGSTLLWGPDGLDGDAGVVAAEAGPADVEVADALAPAAVDAGSRVGLIDEAGTPETAAEPQPALEPASELTGSVFRYDGTPASGATVIVGGFGAFQFMESGKSVPKSAVSAEVQEDGTFNLGELPDKRVLVTAGGAGCAPSESAIWAPGDPTELHLTLLKGVRIFGSIHRPDGSLARERKVRLMHDGGTKDPLGRRLARYITTDDQGLFDERALFPGEWCIVSYPDDEELKEIGGALIDHMKQATVQLGDGEEAHVRLGAPTADSVQVSGRVTLDGKPARGLLQWLREGADPMGSSTNAQLLADGSYSVSLEGPGTWYVRASGAGSGEFFPSIPKSSEHELDFELPTGSLRGHVVDEDGEPVRSVRVTLQATKGAYERGPLRVTADSSFTRKDGSFAIAGLSDGVYVVGAVHADRGVASSVIVEIVGGEATSDTTFVLRGGHRISGLTVGPEGFPANLSAIWIYDEAGRLLNPVAALGTGGSGTFSTPPMPPGRYSLFVQSELSVAEARDLVIGDADLEGVEIQLERGAVVTVQSLVNGDPQRALVSASDDGGRLLTGQRFHSNPWQWRRHPFDSTKKRIGPFPPGTYAVSSHVPGVGTVTEEVTVIGAEALELTLRHE